jgi:predicted glycosyltransferase
VVVCRNLESTNSQIVTWNKHDQASAVMRMWELIAVWLDHTLSATNKTYQIQPNVSDNSTYALGAAACDIKMSAGQAH